MGFLLFRNKLIVIHQAFFICIVCFSETTRPILVNLYFHHLFQLLFTQFQPDFQHSQFFQYNSSLLTFSNFLEGTFGDDPVINMNDRFKVDFSCKYATTYNNIDATTQVESSVNSGDHEGAGSLGFQLHTYLDDSFAVEDTSGSVQIGSTLNFGVEISQSISGIVFTTTDCTVSSDGGLEYGILNDR